MIVPFARLKAIRDDNRSIAEEHAWNEYIRLMKDVQRAKDVADDAHKRYLAIKYPKGAPR